MPSGDVTMRVATGENVVPNENEFAVFSSYKPVIDVAGAKEQSGYARYRGQRSDGAGVIAARVSECFSQARHAVA